MASPHRRPSRLSRATTALALTAALAGSASAQTYDARADFSTTSNPNGVWSYGYASALGAGATPAAVTLYTTAVTGPTALHGWAATFCGDNTPGVYKNTGASTIFYGAGNTGNVGAGQLSLHPGCGNQFSVLRFTAPTTGFTPGSYDLAASFRGADIGYRSVRLFQNGTQLFETFLSSGATDAYAGTRTLAAGDVVDLVVGTEGSYTFDMVEANLTISAAQVPTSPVPEPGTWALLATGLTAIGLVGRRRAQRA
jgi:hypothetical protein